MKFVFFLIISFNIFGQSLEKFIPKSKNSIHFKLSDTQINQFENDFKTQSVSFVNDYKDFLYGFELEKATDNENLNSIERFNFLIGYEKKEKFFSYPYIFLSLGKNSYDFNKLKGSGFSNGLDIGMTLQKLFPLELSGGFKYTSDYFHKYENSTSYDLYLKFSFKFK